MKVTATGAALAVAALVLAPSALTATSLRIPVAERKAVEFAKRTCHRDVNCVRSGVRNCRRDKPRVVFCRIFIRRDTAHQGRYECTRLIRLAPASARTARVTGVGSWSCPGHKTPPASSAGAT